MAVVLAVRREDLCRDGLRPWLRLLALPTRSRRDEHCALKHDPQTHLAAVRHDCERERKSHLLLACVEENNYGVQGGVSGTTRKPDTKELQILYSAVGAVN